MKKISHLFITLCKNCMKQKNMLKIKEKKFKIKTNRYKF